MKSLIAFVSFLLFFSLSAVSQCDYFDDFSSPGDWTQVGTLVEVSSGEVEYIDGSPDGEQRRIYKELDSPYTSDDCWTMHMEFTPDEVGTYQGEPFTGHLIFALTETDQNPFYDCPDVNCTGFPTGTQDAISISYRAKNPPDGNLSFRISIKDNTTKINSEELIYNTLGEIIYVELIKECNSQTLYLNIYSDENYTNPIGDGPVSLDIPQLNDLYYIQHGNQCGGYYRRELTGFIDNVCIKDDGCPNTYGEENYNGCEGDGYEVEVNGNIYDEANPSGTETLVNSQGCDSIVTIELVYNPPTSGEENYNGCEGDGYEVEVNGNTYNESNPTGTEVLQDINGCDSTVTINLVFNPPTFGEENYEGCEGDGYSVEVNGTVYDESNPTGTEVLEDVNGCDSTVTINLVFYENTTGEENYEGCQGDGYEVVVNGTIYNESNPTGTEVLENSNGCDSTVTINLVFHENTTGEENYNGCEGDGYEVEVNGNTYNESNPTGTEVLENSNGCDSTVTINLVFNPPTFGEENYEGCEGDGYSVEVNGTVYDESNPTGTEVLEDVNGCDSTVTINLNYYETTYGEEYYEGCEGDDYEVEVNGTVYDEYNPEGTEVLENANGCDSIVEIELIFYENTYGEEYYEGCEGDGYEVEVNGTEYNEENPTGEEVLENANGCDSIVVVELIFYENTYGEEYYEGCEGDGYEVEVNGTEYNEENPIGEEVLENANGCDSIVVVELVFYETTYGEEYYEGCKGDGYEVEVNGTVYNEENPTGTEVLENTNYCDSTVTINLVYYDTTTGEETHNGCEGDGYEIEVNGTVYNEENPEGVEVLENANGCDSTVTINLSFNDVISTEETYSGCQGDGYEVVVNGNTYNEANPTGTETMVSTGGCDSIVNINLVYNPPTTGEETYIGCEGDGYEVEVNGTVYNENNPTGTEILENTNGCDSTVTIELFFKDRPITLITFNGCKGDGSSVKVGDKVYDENNPNGSDTLQSFNGCDSIINIDLIYYETYIDSINYTGTKGDGYSVTVGDRVYNEDNPRGIDTLQTIHGCDSIIVTNLEFTTSTAEFETKNSLIQLYPNPTKGIVNIYMAKNNNVKIRVLDIHSVVLKEIKTNKTNIKIDMSAFGAQGLYFVQFLDEKNIILDTRKILMFE